MLLIPESEIEIITSRSSGPGGQSVNTTNSRVSLRWNLMSSQVLDDEQKKRCSKKLKNRLSHAGDIILHVQTFKSQLLNKQRAYERLVKIVTQALQVPKKRIKTQVSRTDKKKRLEDKKRLSHKKVLRQNPTSNG